MRAKITITAAAALTLAEMFEAGELADIGIISLKPFLYTNRKQPRMLYGTIAIDAAPGIIDQVNDSELVREEIGEKLQEMAHLEDDLDIVGVSDGGHRLHVLSIQSDAVVLIAKASKMTRRAKTGLAGHVIASITEICFPATKHTSELLWRPGAGPRPRIRAPVPVKT